MLKIEKHEKFELIEIGSFWIENWRSIVMVEKVNIELES